MQHFIPIEWLIKREDMHVNIDCFQVKERKIYFKPICCRKLVDGCDITTCGCDPELGIRIQVYDKYNTLLAESEFVKNIQRIFINKDDLGNISILGE